LRRAIPRFPCACQQFDPIMLGQLVDHGHIVRRPRHRRMTGRRTSK
jgi:hypothetical protein